MANFQVKDAYGSVITIQSSTFGVEERQIVGGQFNISGNPSISGTVNIGNMPSVNAFVTNTPSVNALITNMPSVNAFITNPTSVFVLNPVSILAVNPNPASVLVLNPVSILGVTQIGTWRPSALGYAIRNDAVASFLGADLSAIPRMSDSAGRTVIKPFAPEESRIEGTIALTNTSITTVIAAAGTGLKNYITDFFIANSGSVTTLVTLKDGLGSVLGYTIAPATGGSNGPGIHTPIRTGANATFDIQATNPTSTLYATFTGFKAP